jgi:O-antigen/teichoic acid export membrane protein
MEAHRNAAEAQQGAAPRSIDPTLDLSLIDLTDSIPFEAGMYRRIARNSALLGGGTVVSSVFTILAVAIAARGLTARDFGELVLLQSAVLMLRAIVSVYTQQPVIKLGSDAQTSGDKRRLGKIVCMGLVVDFIASICAVGIAGSLIEFSRWGIGLADRDIGSAWILAASMVFGSYPAANGIFRLYDRFDLLSLIQILSSAGLLIAYAGLFLIGADLRGYIIIWAIYCSLSSLAQLWFSLGLLRRDGVPLAFQTSHFASDDGRTLLHYCWSTWGSSTADTIRTNGDSLVVGAIVSVEAAGLYNAARQVAGLLRKFIGVYSNTVFPEIARLSARRDTNGARRLNRRMLSVGLAIALVAVSLAAVFGREVLELMFGPRFADAHVSLVILTAAAAAQLISQTPSIFVQIYRGPRHILLLQVIAAIVFAAVAIPLTFTLSMVGMAIAQLVFGLVLTVLCNIALKRVRGLADIDSVRANESRIT